MQCFLSESISVVEKDAMFAQLQQNLLTILILKYMYVTVSTPLMVSCSISHYFYLFGGLILQKFANCDLFKVRNFTDNQYKTVRTMVNFSTLTGCHFF